MVEHVVVHIGSDKTGSKAIQLALHKFDDGSAFAAEHRIGHHHSELMLLFEKEEVFRATNIFKYSYGHLNEEELAAERAYFKASFRASLERKDRKTLFFSGEGLPIMEPAGREAMCCYFRSFGVRISVVCYVREPVGYAASGFQQRVRAETLGEVPDRLGPSYLRIFPYYDTLADPDQLIVREFSRASLVGGDVVEDFFALFGMKVDQPAQANESMTLPALKLIMAMNRADEIEASDASIQRRTPVVEAIEAAYADHAKINSRIFAPIADMQECDALWQATGIDFRPKETPPKPFWLRLKERFMGAGPTGPKSHTDIEDILSDLTDIDLTPIHNMLAKAGLPSNATDAVTLGQQLRSLQTKVE